MGDCFYCGDALEQKDVFLCNKCNSAESKSSDLDFEKLIECKDLEPLEVWEEDFSFDLKQLTSMGYF